MQPKKNLVLFLIFGAIAAQTVLGGPELSTDSTHRGLVDSGPYQIFPENRPNNAVYLNHRMVLTLPGEEIIHLLPLPKEGRFVYLTQKESGETQVLIFLPPTDPAPRVKKVADSIYNALIVMEGIVYKKMYRVLQGNTVVDLLPASKTADGVTVSETGVLFYHVSGVDRSEAADKAGTKFAMRLHLVLFQEERLRHLDYPILNTLPSLQLSWIDDTSLKYQLADGRTETLSIAQFQ